MKPFTAEELDEFDEQAKWADHHEIDNSVRPSIVCRLVAMARKSLKPKRARFIDSDEARRRATAFFDENHFDADDSTTRLAQVLVEFATEAVLANDTKPAPSQQRLVKGSARDLVESLTLDAKMLGWCAEKAPGFDPSVELEAFRDRMRANDYKTNAGPVKDAHAAFRTHMRNAVKFGFRVKKAPARTQAKPVERKDL